MPHQSRIAVLSLLVCLSLCAPARAAAEEPFDGYAALCGYPIETRPTARLSYARIDAEGRAVIVLDPRLSSPRQAEHRLFLIAHECAHHRMSHTTQAGLARRMMRRHGTRDQELSADCWAAETMTRLGMDAALRRLADQFWRRGFVDPGQGYPSGIQRSNVMRHCAALAAGKSTTKGVGASRDAAMRDHHP